MIHGPEPLTRRPNPDILTLVRGTRYFAPNGDEFAIVTDHNVDTRASLFHIGSPRVDEVRAMAERLAELPVRVRDCTNVYQGLARLCIADSDKPSALVVSVDLMDAAELEFFRIVARLFPTLLV